MTSAYLSAATVDEALRALGSGARPVAGGTDLVVGARQGKAPLPESIVAIDRLDDLRGLSASGGRLRLGALVRFWPAVIGVAALLLIVKILTNAAASLVFRWSVPVRTAAVPSVSADAAPEVTMAASA